MAPVSVADRCRKYRQKHQEEYREKDALRKKNKRLIMKTVDPVANAERLRKQRLRKQEYRRKMKQAALVNIPVTETVLNSPAISAFSNRSIRSRSLLRAERNLPKSPRKKTEIVTALVEKFELRVKPIENANLGRPKIELSDAQNKWLLNFLDRSDLSYTTPGRKDQQYVGKIDGQSQFVQKRYLLWSLNDILDIINGNTLINEGDANFIERFSRKIKFHELYRFLKSHKEYVYNKAIPQSSCLCEICENAVFVALALNKFLKIGSEVPKDPHSIVETYSCDSSQKDCMSSDCDECYFTGICQGDFKENNEDVKYSCWTKKDGKVSKVVKIISTNEAIDLFEEHVKIFKNHIFIKRVQNRKYNDLKENLKEGEVIIHVDYSENYQNKNQDEIQSAYFGHSTFSIFTACCYLNVYGKVINKNYIVTTEASDHSRIAAHSCIRVIVNALRKEYPNMFCPGNSTVHIWSDGCASQFRSRFVFALMAHFDSTLNFSWYYNERHHGKGPMDGIGGTVKNVVYQHVKSKKCVIDSAKCFAEYADKTVKGISSIYMAQSEMMVEPSSVAVAPKIPKTLGIHKVVRRFNEDGVCVLEFFQLAYDEEPFHTQWYRKEGDPEVCGHNLLPLAFNSDNTCAYCRGKYAPNNEDWLNCQLCEQWFHEKCFHE